MAENTTKTSDGIEIYENAICDYLDQYIDTHEIEDMRREPQSRSASLLRRQRTLENDCMHIKK